MHERSWQNQVYDETCLSCFLIISMYHDEWCSWQQICGEGQASYYIQGINIHDIQVSISAWVSHTKPLILYSRKELHEFGVSVHIVEPGGFVTNMTSSARLTTQLYERWAELSEHKREQYGDQYVKTCELSNLTMYNKIETEIYKLPHCIHA